MQDQKSSIYFRIFEIRILGTGYRVGKGASFMAFRSGWRVSIGPHGPRVAVESGECTLRQKVVADSEGGSGFEMRALMALWPMAIARGGFELCCKSHIAYINPLHWVIQRF